jgi:hypothetical protein
VKVHQQQEFQPITLVLETAQEAEWLWDSVDNRANEGDQGKFYLTLSNWFSTQAQLCNTPPTKEKIPHEPIIY